MKNKYFNYRVLATPYEHGALFSVHAVYYGEDKNPQAYEENAVRLEHMPTLGDIVNDLRYFKQALKRPILWAGDKFPQEYN